MDIRSIDPTECWVRHIRRGAQSDPSATSLGRVYFVRDDIVSGADGLNGRQGWQQAETTAVLSDDGSFTLTLPNAAGDDGVLHRRRFRILTDESYEPGEEWLEFWTDADQERPLFVGTPTDYTKAKSTVTITGRDLTEVLAGSLSSDVDAWDGTAPADVLRHYSRLVVLAYGDTDLGDIVGAEVAWGTAHTVTPTGVASDCWIVEARLRSYGPAPTEGGDVNILRLRAVGLTLEVNLLDGATTLTGPPEAAVTGKRQGLRTPGPVSLRLVARYDRIFAFVEGELVAEFRRASPWPAMGSVVLDAFGIQTQATIDAIHVETLADFACRGASSVVERCLPGLPPGTGLRGRYWGASGSYARLSTVAGRMSRLFHLSIEASEPAVDRLDPQLNFPAGTPNYPPGIAGAYAARWTGAIYLDLAASDRKARLSGLVGNARLYIGKTLRGDEAASSWGSAAGTTPITTGWLRTHLGTSVAGWYPIMVEHTHASAAPGIVLEDSADGSIWATVPKTRLSPIGCYEDLVRNTPHRTVLGDVAQTFGYQWRIEPRSLESGEFPGQLVAKGLVGRQTNIVIDDESVGSDAEVQGAAADVIDGLIVDAAGLADPKGAGQLSAQVVDYARASDHLALRQGYESLSEISEAPLLVTRADSLLTLRSSPNEQVGVRPRGQRDIVDTFPLTGTLARMDWMPGDGALLDLDSIDVKDTSSRQMTTITWHPRRDGLGAPTVGFRQRPRSVKAAMRRLTAAVFGPRRTYQGSIAITTGAIGGATSAGAAFVAVDGYSRATLPANLDDIVRVVAAVQVLSGSGWRLEVTGTDLGAPDGAVTTVGRYDITRAAKASSAGAPYIYARLIGGTSGNYVLTLEVHVRV